MENRRYVYVWEEDYKQLKHVRWVRNQLAHEVGTLDSGVCTEGDLALVKSFYNRIINGRNPFTVIRKAKEDEMRQAKQQAQARKSAFTDSRTPTPKKTYFWKRLVSNIKSFFIISK